MSSNPTLQEQQHPQYKNDREIVNKLLNESPNNSYLVELARLKIRYKGFPGAWDIQKDLETLMQNWGYTEETLYEKTRQIHASGEAYQRRKTDQEDWI